MSKVKATSCNVAWLWRCSRQCMHVLNEELLQPITAQNNSQHGFTQWRIVCSSPIQKWRDEFIWIKTEKSFRIHIPMHIKISMIATVMRQALEEKCEAVGQDSFALPNACQEKRGKRKRWTIFLERMRQDHCQSDEHWIRFKGNVWGNF